MNRFFVVFVSFLVLTACGDQRTANRVEPGIQNQVPIPSPIQRFVAANPADGELHGYIRINGGERNPMTISGNQAQITLSGLTPGDLQFAIEFVFDSQTYGEVPLAESSKSLNLQSGQNSLGFETADYTYPDNDDDQIDNLTELEQGTDPTNPDTRAPATAFSPSSRIFRGALPVTLTCTDDPDGSGCAAIHYTTDNSDPDTDSAAYSGPIMLSATTALKFFSVDNAGNKEAFQTVNYTLSSINGQFSRPVAAGVTPTNVTTPFGTVAYHKLQMLYGASETGGSGLIYALSLKRLEEVNEVITCPETVIRLGHTDLTELTDTYSANVERGQGSQQTTLFTKSLAIPAGPADGYFEIEFEKPFFYNGVDNLVVQIERTGACSQDLAMVTEKTETNTALDTTTQGDTGGLINFLHHTVFHFDGGDNRLHPTTAGSPGYREPFGDTINNKVQLLYLAGEIGGHGPLTGIGLPIGESAPVDRNYSVTVKMGHFTEANLTTTFTDNFSDEPVLVADEVSFTVPAYQPANESAWIPIPDNVFEYNNKSNLVIEIQAHNSSGNMTWKGGVFSKNIRRIFANIAETDAGLKRDDVPYGLKLRFAGGTANVITDGAIRDGIPYNPNPVRRQVLYRAAELGSGGVIDRIAHRLNAVPTLAGNYTDCSVVMGHTTVPALGVVSFSGNMSDAREVFRGPFNVPTTGVDAGDWLEVPLEAAFLYDGVRNLVVDMSCLTGTTTTFIRGTSTDGANRYPMRRAYHFNSNTEDQPQGTTDNMIDFRMWLQ